jgi:aminopeptidase YwaD
MSIGSEIYTLIGEICSCGPRWMGTPGATHAINYIGDAFRSKGMEVRLEKFQYLSYRPQEVRLEVEGRAVRCEPIALAASTKVPLTAPLVWGGQCAPKELEDLVSQGRSIEDAIVISDNLRTFLAYPNVEDAGGAGFISVTGFQDGIIRCGSARLDRRPGAIPGLSISGREGDAILERLRSGCRLVATMELKGQIEQTEGVNVVVSQPGPRRGKILVTAHYDSFWNGVHAMDNASGVATVIALSRLLAKHDGPSIEYVFFGAEELGLFGSHGYVEAHSDKLEEIIAVINFDNFGSSASQLEVGVTEELFEVSKEVAEKHEIQVHYWSCPPRAASDHHCFVQKGVPAVWFANGGSDLHYHTPLDVPEKMDPDRLEQVAIFAHALVRELSR